MSVAAQPLWATSLSMSRCGACPCMSFQAPTLRGPSNADSCFHSQEACPVCCTLHGLEPCAGSTCERRCYCVQDLLQCMSFRLAKRHSDEPPAQLRSCQALVETAAAFLRCSELRSCTPCCSRCHHRKRPSSTCSLPAAIQRSRLCVQLCSYQAGLGPHSSRCCRTCTVLLLPKSTQGSSNGGGSLCSLLQWGSGTRV